MQWSFHLGYTSFTKTADWFHTPHQINSLPWSGLGIDIRSPLEKKTKKPKYQKELWHLATEVIRLVDPEFVRLQYVVHFAKMTSNCHHCRVHVDGHDIAPQYIIHFGHWEGAELRAYNTTKEERTPEYMSFDKPRKIIYIDSRLAHEVVKTFFSGVRFTMIVYQLWREDKFVPDPYVYPPRVVN
jgi:hypothetical protein